MTDALFLLVIISYFILAYIITQGIRNLIKPFYRLSRFIILSFFYALFFGFGLIGGGGPHGFVFPVPVIFLPWMYIEPGRIFNDVITPLFFWWGLILVIMISVYLLKKSLSVQKKVEN